MRTAEGHFLVAHRAGMLKSIVFFLGTLPAVWLVTAVMLDRLGPNPAEALIRTSGDWALRFLCIALAVTPARVAFALPVLAQWRRMLGLYCFFYASVHAMLYAGLDMELDGGLILADLLKRPFILLGFLAWFVLSLLAMTSWNGAIRLLGSARWRALHRWVYLVPVLGLLHFFWMRQGKNDFSEVWLYTAVLVLLLSFRCIHWAMRTLHTRSR